VTDRPSAPRPPSRVQTVVVTHGLAIAALLFYTWFVFQPVRGSDIVLWGFELGVFFVIGAWLIAAGVFAWVRWDSGRALVLGDLLGLVPPGIVAFLYQILGIILFLPVLIPVLVGLFLAHGEPRLVEAGSRIRQTHPLLLATIAAPIVISWWYAFTWMFDAFGLYREYAFGEAVTSGVAVFAVLLWLDRRPGLLLGTAVASAYHGASSVAVGVEYGSLENIVVGSVLLLSGLLGGWVAGRDVVEHRVGTAPLRSLVVAAAASIAAFVATLLAPLVVVLALVIERPHAVDSPEEPDASIPIEAAAA
jgi:hypothetical protein